MYEFGPSSVSFVDVYRWVLRLSHQGSLKTQHANSIYKAETHFDGSAIPEKKFATTSRTVTYMQFWLLWCYRLEKQTEL